MTMINVTINPDDMLTMLNDRVAYWTDDETARALYSDMYERAIYGGGFSGCNFDVLQIVDNDYINWCQVITKDDKDFAKLCELYKRDGLTDVSCEDFEEYKIAFIEAVDDEDEPKAFLVRM